MDSETTLALNLWCSLKKSSFILTANISSLDALGRSAIMGLYITDDFGNYQTTCWSKTGEGFNERVFEANGWIYFRQSKLLSNMRVSVSACFSTWDKFEHICMFNKKALDFFIKERHRRSRHPCVYYANSTATSICCWKV